MKPAKFYDVAFKRVEAGDIPAYLVGWNEDNPQAGAYLTTVIAVLMMCPIDEELAASIWGLIENHQASLVSPVVAP